MRANSLPISPPHESVQPSISLTALRRRVAWYCLAALMLVNALLPWWTLSAFPILSIGAAKVHLVDVLTAAVVLGAIPEVVAKLKRSAPVLASVGFVVYLTIPFVFALGDTQQLFYAVREARPLTYHLLVAAIVALNLSSRRLSRLATLYIAGALGAVLLTFLHVKGILSLPGYRPQGGPLPTGIDLIEAAEGFRVFYLEWTVVLVAAILIVVRLLQSTSLAVLSTRLLYLTAIVWYQVASAGRYLQLVSLAAIAGLLALMARRRALILLGLTVLILGAGFLVAVGVGAPWARNTTETTLVRWTEWRSDESLGRRTTEARLIAAVLKESPVIGRGLGGALDVPGYDLSLGRYVYIHSGYAAVALKSGLLGLALYLTLLAVLFRTAMRGLARSAPPDVRAMRVVGLVGLASLTLLQLLHPVVLIPEGAIALALFSGMVAVRETPSLAPRA